MPAAPTRTTASPGPGTGAATCSTRRARGAWSTAALTPRRSVVCRSRPPAGGPSGRAGSRPGPPSPDHLGGAQPIDLGPREAEQLPEDLLGVLAPEGVGAV